MPSINSTEDLLNLLERNEEFRNAVRRWVLGDELLSMPALMRRMDERLASVESTQRQVAALLEQIQARMGQAETRLASVETTQQQTAALLKQVAARLDALETRQDKTEAWQERTGARLDKTDEWQKRSDARQDRSEAWQKRSDARQDRTDEWQKRSEEWQERTDARLDRTDEWQKRSDARHDRAEARLDRLETDVATLKGLSLQSQLHHIGLNAVVSRFRIRGARLVRAVGSGASDTEFNDAVLDAMDSGLISDDDYTRLMATDMVVSGALAGTNVYVAVEVSFTISSDDIDKVKHSASLIKRVYPDIDARAALYYFAADDERRMAAADAGVEIIRAEIRPA